MHTERLVEAIETAQRSGLAIDVPAVERASEGVSPVDLALVLDAATAFVRGDSQLAFRRLDLCWGARTDASVSLVFETGVVSNRESLLQQVAAAVDQRSRHDSARVHIGQSIALHKLIKNGIEPSPPLPVTRGTRASKFQLRNHIIGRVMATDDVDLVDSYRTELNADPSTAVNELWSLATYSGDVPISRDVKSPRRYGVRRTARDVINDMATARGGYAYYLAHVAVPTLLSADQGFGGHLDVLREAVSRTASRAEDAGDRPLLRAAHALRHSVDAR